MGWRASLLVLLCAAGCLRADLVECSDGRACPSGRVCDVVHASCVTAAQTTVCAGIVDGERCDAAGVLGLCDQRICVPGCGDSVQLTGEECDDGNARDHDGCSSACLTESPQWTRWRSPWAGRVGHTAAYQPTKGVVVVGGSDDAAVQGDSWQFTSSDDWMLNTAAAPPARRLHAMAYDPVRGRLVLFGGFDTNDATLGDTWEHDGTAWTQRMLTTTPGPRAGSIMVYDINRQRIVMYSGSGETWEYNGAWSKLTSPSPPARIYFAMAYDALRGKTVLHGGVAVSTALDDTWEYDGSWTQVSVQGPSARAASTMAYSASRKKVVLFGGVVIPDHVGNDTWEYDGGTWTTVPGGATIPPARYYATLTALPDGTLQLVGGADAEGRPRPDVWAYTNTGVWSEVSPNLIPPPRESPMVYDDARGVLTMFGGLTIVARGDSWQFDGSLWHATPPGLLTRARHGIAYDSKRMRTVLFGGNDMYGSVLGSTMEGTPVGWGPVSTVGSPSARTLPALAYDPNAAVTVLFGGRAGTARLDDTWEYDGTTWTQNTSSQHPEADDRMMLAYDPIHRFIVGVGQRGVTWVYENHSWRAYPDIAAPPPRSGGNLVFNTARGTTMLLGGYGADNTYHSELWELSFNAGGEPSWQRTDVTGVKPDGRVNAGAAYMPAIQSVVLYGGTTGAGPRNDTWLLTYD